MNTYTVLTIIIIIISLLAMWYIIIYNKIKNNQSKIEKVESIIDEDLRHKYDLLMEIEQNIPSKKDYFKEFKELKNADISNFDLERKLKEAEITIKKAYEDLKPNNDNTKELFYQIKTTNEKISAGISYYNHHMNKRNDYIRKFPNNIIAHLHGITTKPFFDQKDMTDDIIDDFKL